MTNPKGFTICVSSRYDGWWRYNVALMCGCFDAEDRRTGFASVESHVAEVGSNLKAKPREIADDRQAVLETPPCDHLICYLYIVPHTLPDDRAIDDTKPFEIEVQIAYAGHTLRTQHRTINQWSGASIEMRIEQSEQA